LAAAADRDEQAPVLGAGDRLHAVAAGGQQAELALEPEAWLVLGVEVEAEAWSLEEAGAAAVAAAGHAVAVVELGVGSLALGVTGRLAPGDRRSDAAARVLLEDRLQRVAAIGRDRLRVAPCGFADLLVE